MLYFLLLPVGRTNICDWPLWSSHVLYLHFWINFFTFFKCLFIIVLHMIYIWEAFFKKTSGNSIFTHGSNHGNGEDNKRKTKTTRSRSTWNKKINKGDTDWINRICTTSNTCLKNAFSSAILR